MNGSYRSTDSREINHSEREQTALLDGSNNLPKRREATARAAQAATGEVSAYGRGGGVGRGLGVG